MPKVFKNYREESRTNWGTNVESHENISSEQIKLGAFLRMADAVEKMATPFARAIEEKETYQRWYNDERAENARLYKRIAALQGVITKMKRKASK